MYIVHVPLQINSDEQEISSEQSINDVAITGKNCIYWKTQRVKALILGIFEDYAVLSKFLLTLPVGEYIVTTTFGAEQIARISTKIEVHMEIVKQ